MTALGNNILAPRKVKKGARGEAGKSAPALPGPAGPRRKAPHPPANRPARQPTRVGSARPPRPTATPALAQDTLDKIKASGVLVIGTRTGSPPFAYVNKNNEWVGFSIDLVEQLVKPEVEKAVGKSIKVEKKESAPATRIPLLTSNSVDLIAGTMTDTPQRRASVDF